jgi:hypothetical protein
LINKDDALIKINWFITFISAFVLRKEYINNNFTRFFGTGFLHTPIIMDCIKQGNVIITNNIHLLCRQGNSGGYNIYKYFGTNIMSIINFYKKNKVFNEKTINVVITEWLRSCVRSNVIYCKMNLNKTFELNNKMSDLVLPFFKYKYFIFKILPILIIPRCILKFIMIIKKKII